MKHLFRIVLCSLILSPACAHAQHLWEAGIFGGISNYEGGLAQYPVWKESHPAFGVFVKRNTSGYVSFSLGFNYGKISGNDSNNASTAPRGLKFQSNLYELTSQVELNFFKFGSSDIRGALRFSPYIFTGLSLFYFNPTAIYNGRVYDLQGEKTEGQGITPGAPAQYNRLQVAIPFGGGLKINLSERLNLLVLMGYRATFTSDLDDAGPGNYVQGSLLNPRGNPANIYFADPTNIGVPGEQRGNPDKDDWYLFAGISLSYIIPGPICPYAR